MIATLYTNVKKRKKKMKTKLPDDQELIAKKHALNEAIDNALASNRKTNKITVRDKLRLLNDELIRFKTSGVSFKVVRGLLAERVGLNVSEQTLREYCQQELGFKKRGVVVSIISTESDASRLTNKLSSHDSQFMQDPVQLSHSSKNQMINEPLPSSTPNAVVSTPATEVLQVQMKEQGLELNRNRISSPVKPAINSAVSNKIEQQTTELLSQIEDF